MLERIKEWALLQEEIRTVLLVGSRGAGGKQDTLSDYDISLFGQFNQWANRDDWLKEIGPYWLCIHDQFQWGNFIFPTRLVLFQDGTKFDFAFHAAQQLEKMIDDKQLSLTYDLGYKVIVDKDGRAGHLARPSLLKYNRLIPKQEELTNAWNEFWFEAYQVAKYICRCDFWAAKLRDEAMKKWMLKMLEWNSDAKSGSSKIIRPDGKNLRDWLEEDYYLQLDNCFSGWGQPDGIASLYSCIDLFVRVAKETAFILHLELAESQGEGVKEIITQIIESSHAKR